MGNISKKTLEDLEFPHILREISTRCHTELGKVLTLEIAPISEESTLLGELERTSEYLGSLESGNRFPHHSFDEITSELRLLQIENSALSVSGCIRIKDISSTFGSVKKYLLKLQEHYRVLRDDVDKIEFYKEIPKTIDQIVDRFGEIRDDASVRLKELRLQMGQVRTKIDRSFATALNLYRNSEYLDEIKESVVDGRRVLAVKAMYRKKVSGSVMGTSKTGSIVFIAPEATSRFIRELSDLEFEENEEIQKILREITKFLSPFYQPLRNYQDFLAKLDSIAARALYAKEIDGVKPNYSKDRVLHIRDAYHPILLRNNRKKKEKTYPQTVLLDSENRIIVISGPNAGGKSITLKTIGLLQIMWQSGLLIPVHEGSAMRIFDSILTDIGDNQSIENHLSTYSYRLKNMNRFLKNCNDKTLFLIDEFGTGSDPELGGALAEIFLEVFYEKGSYGVITTHYANLKALANELPHAQNANMLFNSKTLEPTFQLVLGEAGSSFTFEVAQKNGIPFSLINKAKKKIERGKVRFDATIAKLQKERSKMAQTGSRLKEEEARAKEEAERLEELNDKVKTKLVNYQQLYDNDQRMIHLGNRVDAAAEKYFLNGKKRPLISELLRIVETENSKRQKKSKQKTIQEREKKAKVAEEAQKVVQKIRKEKKEKTKKQPKATSPKPILKIGDRVRLMDGKAVGSIDSLEKNKAVVNYGIFTTSVNVDQLELVEAKK